MANQTKLRITVTLLPIVNSMLEQISKKSGLSKSLLVEKALKDYLKKELEQEAKVLSKMHFEDLPSEDEWISIQSNI